jgi:hypothetical protein
MEDLAHPVIAKSTAVKKSEAWKLNVSTYGKRLGTQGQKATKVHPIETNSSALGPAWFPVF